MDIKSIYTKKIEIAIRVSALLAVFFLGASNVLRIHEFYTILQGTESFSSSDWLGRIAIFSVNTICFVCCLLLLCFPYKLGLITVMAFLQSVSCSVGTFNYMFLLMYLLVLVTLLVRGFFSAHKKRKVILCAVLYVALNFMPLIYGTEDFVEGVFRKTAAVFVIAVSFFFYRYYLFVQKQKKQGAALNLADYPELNKRDVDILTKVQQHIKYDAIAIDLQLAPGTVKNRLKQIYAVLEVGDKRGFLNQYEKSAIVYTPVQKRDKKGGGSVNPQ